jgi:hypothetical protein
MGPGSDPLGNGRVESTDGSVASSVDNSNAKTDNNLFAPAHPVKFMFAEMTCRFDPQCRTSLALISETSIMVTLY